MWSRDEHGHRDARGVPRELNHEKRWGQKARGPLRKSALELEKPRLEEHGACCGPETTKDPRSLRRRLGRVRKPKRKHAGPPVEIPLVDLEKFAQEMASLHHNGDPATPSTSAEHDARLAFLRRYAGRAGGFARRQLIADETKLERLRALKDEAPNAARVVEIAERAALLSRHAGSPLQMPPILIVGPPGAGKSFVARRLAGALAAPLTVIDGATTTDRGPLVGHDVGYRGAGPGKIASALLEGSTASPLILFDEVDKVLGYNGYATARRSPRSSRTDNGTGVHRQLRRLADARGWRPFLS